MPQRTASGGSAEAVYRALEAVLPKQEAYDVESLSCVQIAFPGQESTHCQLDQVRVDDTARARPLLDALKAAGAEWDMRNKMPAVRAQKVHAARDAVRFEDQANAPQPWTPNARLEGKAMHDVMNALASAGIKEDDGTLFVVCNAFSGEPSCGYHFKNAAGTPLDRAQSLGVWNAFVQEPSITVLNASHFAYDGQALSFYRVLDTVRPPSH